MNSVPLEKTPAQQSGPAGTVVGAAGSVGAATMISRILGVVREMVMARYFGAGLYTDAFNVAYRIPNLLRDLFAEGALSSAFVPTFIRTAANEGRESAWLLANRVINALVVILGAVTLLFYFGAMWFVYLLASGYAAIPEKFELTVQMTRILSPFLLWVAIAAVVMGMLNACGVFFVPAMAPSAFNVCCIAAGIFLSPFMPRWGYAPVVSMAVGALAGGILQFAVQLPAAYRAGYRYRFSLDFSDPGLRHIGKLMVPALVGLSATQINITVDNQLASRFGNGPVSWLNYGFRLMQLPVGVFGVAIATATMATVSHHAAHHAIAKVRDTVSSSLRLAACLTFPATVGLVVFRREIVALLYERGLFTASDTLQTSRVLLLYSLALFSYSAVKILVPTFYALNDTRTPVRTSVTTVAVKIALNFLFIFRLQFLGLALATTAASWINFALLWRGLGAKTGNAWHWRGLVPYARIALASVIMGLIAQVVYAAADWVLPLGGTAGLALKLGAAIGAGMGVVFPLFKLLGVQEVNEVWALVKRKLPGRR